MQRFVISAKTDDGWVPLVSTVDSGPQVVERVAKAAGPPSTLEVDGLVRRRSGDSELEFSGDPEWVDDVAKRLDSAGLETWAEDRRVKLEKRTLASSVLKRDRPTRVHKMGVTTADGQVLAEWDVTGEAVAKRATSNVRVPIAKTDEDQRLVFGFAKLAEDPDNRGYYLVDSQGDLVSPDEVEKAAYAYVETSRESGAMHEGEVTGPLVESVVFTPEKLEAMGLEPDAIPTGAWWTGYRVEDDDAWDGVKKGRYTAFSIEGSAVREEVEE